MTRPDGIMGVAQLLKGANISDCMARQAGKLTVALCCRRSNI
ncbi:hypothetical protein [Kaarinaea lacus]